MNDIILGAIIGCGGAILGNFFSSLFSYRLDKKKTIRNERKEVYEMIENFTLELVLNKPFFVTPEGKTQIHNVAVKVGLYCSHKISSLFEQITTKIGGLDGEGCIHDNDIQNNLDKILVLMRYDLGIENKWIYRLKHFLLK